MNRRSHIFVAGHKGLVGSAIVRRLSGEGYENIFTATRDQLDLTRQGDVEEWLKSNRIETILLAAAKVGGIKANDDHPAAFLTENLKIQTSVIDAAYQVGVRKLVFLGSSCIYPKHTDQPIAESQLLTGALEPTNEWYAIAKIAGLKMCAAYRRQYGFDAISLMPTNLYGPNDNFDLETSHVLPALIRKFHEAKMNDAKTVEIWGSGRPRREFLHVDDLAVAIEFLAGSYSDEDPINVGTGVDIEISELAFLIRDIVDYRGDIVFDPSKPDGTARKVLNVGRLEALGWQTKIPLRAGIETTYEWYCRNH